MMTDCELPDILHHPSPVEVFVPPRASPGGLTNSRRVWWTIGRQLLCLALPNWMKTTRYSNQSICKRCPFGLMINLTGLCGYQVIKSSCHCELVKSCRAWVCSVFLRWHITLGMDARYIHNNIVTTALRAPSGISSVLCTQGTRGIEEVCTVQSDLWL